MTQIKIVAQNYADTPSYSDAQTYQKSQQGTCLAMSYDGLTMIVGAPGNDSGIGCVFIFVRKGLESVWTQQGNRIRGRDYSVEYPTRQGSCVAISDSGDTIAFGGPEHDDGIGRVWIFKRINNSWYESGELSGKNINPYPNYGSSVALSGDGLTLAIGATRENFYSSATWSGNDPIGAVYIARLLDGIWTETSRLVGGVRNGIKSAQGTSLALSTDGTTLAVGCFTSVTDIFVFKSSGLYDWIEEGHEVFFNSSASDIEDCNNISISGDGNTLIFGGRNRKEKMGCTWVFTRNNDKWSYDQMFLIDTVIKSNSMYSLYNHQVSLSADKNILAILVTSATDKTTSLHIKRKDNNTWTNICDPIYPDRIVSLNQINIPITLSGNGLSFAYGNKSNNNNTGRVVSYKLHDERWILSYDIIGADFIGRSEQGSSVVISDDGLTMAIGGNKDNDSKGSVWIYNKSNGQISGEWIESNQKLTTGPRNYDKSLFGSSLAISKKGDVIAVGAPGETFGYGTVYVFKKRNNIWSQDGDTLRPQNIELGSHEFGQAIAMSDNNDEEFGQVIAMGSPKFNNNIGGIITFKYTPNGWKQFGSITSSKDQFILNQGTSVSLTNDGMMMAVGCPADFNGCVIIFRRVIDKDNGFDHWQQSAKIVGSTGLRYTNQGTTVCIDGLGNTLAFSCPNYNDNMGCVWVFVYANYIWCEMQKLVGSDGNQGDFGSGQGTSISLSKDGRNLAFGGRLDEHTSGAVWCYKSTDQGWIQLGKKRLGNLRKDGSQCGNSVSLNINSNEIAFGGPLDDQGIGAVWIDKFEDK